MRSCQIRQVSCRYRGKFRVNESSFCCSRLWLGIHDDWVPSLHLLSHPGHMPLSASECRCRPWLGLLLEDNSFIERRKGDGSWMPYWLGDRPRSPTSPRVCWGSTAFGADWSGRQQQPPIEELISWDQQQQRWRNHASKLHVAIERESERGRQSMDGVRSEDKASRCFHSYGGRRIIRSSAAALPRFPTACRPAGASGSSSWHPSPSFDDHAALRWPALISSSQAAHATRLSWCCHTQLRLKTQPPESDWSWKWIFDLNLLKVRHMSRPIKIQNPMHDFGLRLSPSSVIVLIIHKATST